MLGISVVSQAHTYTYAAHMCIYEYVSLLEKKKDLFECLPNKMYRQRKHVNLPTTQTQIRKFYKQNGRNTKNYMYT